MGKKITNRMERQVKTGAITGLERTPELIEKAFGSFVGRELKNAYRIIRRMIKEDHTIVLSVSGAMVPVDFGVSCLIPLMKAGLVDILTTTGANLYHDIQRLETEDWYEVSPQTDDVALHKEGWARIHDTIFPDQSLLDADQLVCRFMERDDMAGSMTTPEFHYRIGRLLDQTTKRHHPKAQLERSLLVQAARHGIPVFCGAPQDSSIFLNLALLKRKWRDRYRFSLDIEGDIHEFGAYHYLSKKTGSRKLSIIILGGGVPKNYSLQPEPYLKQICGVDVDGYDADVQICDAHLQNGGLSSCTASEAHTWGKTSADCIQNSQYVFADVTAVFPFIVHALLQEGLQRKPRALYERRDEALVRLDKVLIKQGTIPARR